MATINDQPAEKVDQEVHWTSMTRMLDLRNVLELINDGLRDGALTKQNFVHQGHEHVFHVGANASHKLNAEGSQPFFSKPLGNVAFIGQQLAKEFPNHLGNGLAIIDIAGCEQQVEHFTSSIENQVQLEAKEPAGGGFSTLSQSCKDLVRMDSWVFARRQGRGIHEGNACTGSQAGNA